MKIDPGKLAELLKERKMCWADLARLLKVSRMACSHWKSGTKGMNAKHTQKVAAFFEVSVEELRGSKK
jgi:DNA transposition AAA+ family ATPase